MTCLRAKWLFNNYSSVEELKRKFAKLDLFIFKIYFFDFVCVGVLHAKCVSTTYMPGCLRSDPMELDLQMVLNNHVVLGIKPGTSGRAA